MLIIGLGKKHRLCVSCSVFLPYLLTYNFGVVILGWFTCVFFVSGQSFWLHHRIESCTELKIFQMLAKMTYCSTFSVFIFAENARSFFA